MLLHCSEDSSRACGYHQTCAYMLHQSHTSATKRSYDAAAALYKCAAVAMRHLAADMEGLLSSLRAAREDPLRRLEVLVQLDVKAEATCAHLLAHLDKQLPKRSEYFHKYTPALLCKLGSRKCCLCLRIQKCYCAAQMPESNKPVSSCTQRLCVPQEETSALPLIKAYFSATEMEGLVGRIMGKLHTTPFVIVLSMIQLSLYVLAVLSLMSFNNTTITATGSTTMASEATQRSSSEYTGICYCYLMQPLLLYRGQAS
eukprot:6893-Heterococcus_DN1.PRE.4